MQTITREHPNENAHEHITKREAKEAKNDGSTTHKNKSFLRPSTSLLFLVHELLPRSHMGRRAVAS